MLYSEWVTRAVVVLVKQVVVAVVVVVVVVGTNIPFSNKSPIT